MQKDRTVLWTRRLEQPFGLSLSRISATMFWAVAGYACIVDAGAFATDHATDQAVKQAAHQAADQQFDGLWFHGTTEAAFAKAKAEGKPLLLYWGAIWCPPCNELKQQVFTQPRFTELTKDAVRAHLDGDAEAAQIWGERLKIAGYPTVLLFDRLGKEVMRLGSSLSMTEFATAYTSALAGSDLRTAIDRALAGKASIHEWRLLAYYAWDDQDVSGLTPVDLLAARIRLPSLVPTGMRAERAALAANALMAAAQASDADAKSVGETLKPRAAELAEMFLVGDEEIHAARSVIAYGVEDIASWAFGTASPATDKTRQLWLAAAKKVTDDASLSTDTRLWASYPEIVWYRLAHPQQSLPVDLVQRIQASVATADQRAVSPLDRHSVISGAAYMLREVGDFAGARRILDKELSRTDTPWYYQSAYAGVERAAGNADAALAWATKARQSVRGRASRIQWIVEDLALIAKLPARDQEQRLLAVVRDYYDTALTLPDGFVGRNASRATRVAEALKPFASRPVLRGLLETYAKRCQARPPGAMTAPGGEPCGHHFAAVLSGA